MKKRILTFICICGMAGTLFACGDDKENISTTPATETTVDVSSEKTATSANDETDEPTEKNEICNNGRTVVKYGDGYIYWKYNSGSYETQAPLAEYKFISTNKNELIYEKADGTTECILKDTGAGEIYVTDEYIFFERYISDYETEICSIGRKDGKWDSASVQTVCKGDIHAIDTERGILVVSRENNLSVMDIHTGAFTDTQVNGAFIMYNAGKIYYQGATEDYTNAALGELTIYVADIKGQSSLLIKTTSDMYDFADGGAVEVQCMQIHNGYVYYSYGNYAGTANYYQGGNICRMTLEGKDNEVFATYAAEDFYVYDKAGKTKLIYASAYESLADMYVKELDVETRVKTDSELPLGALDKAFNSSSGTYTYYSEADGKYTTLLTWEDIAANQGEGVTSYDVEHIEVIGNNVFYTVIQSKYNAAVSVGWRDGYDMVKTDVYCKNLDDGKIRLVYGYPENVSVNKEEETTSANVMEKETTTKKETVKQETTTKQQTTQKQSTTQAQTTTQKQTEKKTEVATTRQEESTTEKIEGVHWKLEGTTLTIYGTGAMKDYQWNDDTGVNTPWKSSLDKITSIVVSEGITSIGKLAFCDCSKVTSVSLPSTLSYIGYGAFLRCKSLTEIYIPNNVENISGMAFASCENLKNFNFPSKLWFIGEYAFCGCSSLTELTIPDTVTTVGEYCFWECTGLKTVKCSKNMTQIQSGMFEQCTNLISIEIPENITSIFPYAFNRCNSLTTVYGSAGSYAQIWAEENGYSFVEK